MKCKKVSILILTYNNKMLLNYLLKSIIKRTHYPNYEVYVIDNASIDGTEGMIKKKYDWVKYIRNNENLGFIRAYNAIYKKIQTDFYLTLNDDTLIITDNWLIKLINSIEENKDIGAIYPLEIIPPEIGKISKKGEKIKEINIFLKEKIKEYEKWGNSRPQENIIKGKLIEGPAILYNARIINCTQLFEPLLIPIYYEDTDLGLKILRAGFNTALNPNVCIIHFHSVVIQSVFKKFQRRLQLGRNRIILGFFHRNTIDLMKQIIFEFKTFIYEIFKLKIDILSSSKYYFYILKNFKKILQGRQFRKNLYKMALNKEYYEKFGPNNLSIIFKNNE